MPTPPVVSISIDTEEDNWGSFARRGASARNIAHLPELQDRFDAVGAKPTYLVNLAPLEDREGVAILGALSARPDVEIGAHCHPWNTPPDTGEGVSRSMMHVLTADENRRKLATVRNRLLRELDVRPTSFRAGRWGFGPTVAVPLLESGFEVDCSVSPYVDWSDLGGPDYSDAPDAPYAFSPERPLVPEASGALLELPTTVGFLRGEPRSRNRMRRRLEGSWASRLKLVGLADRAGLLARRWLSPETSTAADMTCLVDARLVAGARFLQVTFHSSTLLPGATPFVRDEHDRRRFLKAISTVLEHCRASGCSFATLTGVGRQVRSEMDAQASDCSEASMDAR